MSLLSETQSRGLRIVAVVCLGLAAVSCSSSDDKKDFTNRPGANSPATAGTAPTSSTGTNDQGNSG